jgi:hypothetical protein
MFSTREVLPMVATCCSRCGAVLIEESTRFTAEAHPDGVGRETFVLCVDCADLLHDFLAAPRATEVDSLRPRRERAPVGV